MLYTTVILCNLRAVMARDWMGSHTQRKNAPAASDPDTEHGDHERAPVKPGIVRRERSEHWVRAPHG